MNPGTLLDHRFFIERQAGSGGTSAVHRAIDQHTGHAVALKLLNPRTPRSRFEREAALLASLTHPAIVRYVAHGATPSGELYLVMEWLEGEDLSERLIRGKLSIADTVVLFSRVADALGAAHARGIVHRDIKPSNLFLVHGDVAQVKLLDFGIALPAPALRTTQSTAIVGTLGYLAPEQARAEPWVDARADVFSLGCVLFECLTGRAAFSAEHPMAVLAKVLLEDLPPVHEINGNVPPRLGQLIDRMLCRLPEHRPRDGNAVALELATLPTIQALPLDAPHIFQPTAITSGEQRLVCVLLADTRPNVDGPVDPAAATVMSSEDNRTMTKLRQICVQHHARLEQLLDRSMLMTFESQGAATDQAANAARCALAVRRILPHVPMAFSTGRAIVTERWPTGEAIDRAVALLDHADAADSARYRAIRVDNVTAGLLELRFHLQSDDKGLLLQSERDTTLTFAARTLLGRPTPCVGRERELTRMVELFDACESEPMARALITIAPAGAGKSRLCYEFLGQIRDRACIWLGRGDPLGVGSPFAMIADPIRQAAGIRAGDPLFVKVQKLHDYVCQRIPADQTARVTTFLGEVVGMPFDREELDTMERTDERTDAQMRAARRDGQLMGDQMRRALEDILIAECAVKPLVIVLEDLQWGDSPSLQFLDSALRRLKEKPLFVLALGRPEVTNLFPGLWSQRATDTVHLGPLSRKACEVLVTHTLGQRAQRDLVTKLVEHAAGNAFYLEELIRDAATGQHQSLPGTVVAMAQSRLEALDPEARRILRAASIFGVIFWDGAIVQLLGGAYQAADVRESLDDLVMREILVACGERKFSGQQEYAFRLALVRQAAYEMLTDVDRRVGHRLAAAWLERCGEGDALVLAEHFERGGEPERAVSWYLRSAEHALEGNDLDGAIARAQRGLQCATVSTPSQILGSLWVIQATAHRWHGRNEDALKAGLEAMRLLPLPSEGWLTAAAEVSVVSVRLGDHTPLLTVAKALAYMDTQTLASRGITADVVVAVARCATQLLYAGHGERADDLFDQLQKLSPGIDAVDPAALARVLQARGIRAIFAGDLEAHIALMEEAATHFEDAGDLRNACVQRVNVTFAKMEMGTYTRVEQAMRDALAAAERMGLASLAALACCNLGAALAHEGVLDEAKTVEQRAVEAFAAQGDRRMEGSSRINLAAILLQAGDLSGAKREAEWAIERLSSSPPSSAYALAMLGRIELAYGNAAEALMHATKAMGLLLALHGVEEGESTIRLVHAQALLANGERAAAQVAIQTARDNLLARAKKIANPLLRQSFLENVVDNAHTLKLAWALSGTSQP